VNILASGTGAFFAIFTVANIFEDVYFSAQEDGAFFDQNCNNNVKFAAASLIKQTYISGCGEISGFKYNIYPAELQVAGRWGCQRMNPTALLYVCPGMNYDAVSQVSIRQFSVVKFTGLDSALPVKSDTECF
jgi:hypothetical protein